MRDKGISEHRLAGHLGSNVDHYFMLWHVEKSQYSLVASN